MQLHPLPLELLSQEPQDPQFVAAKSLMMIYLQIVFIVYIMKTEGGVLRFFRFIFSPFVFSV